MRAGCFAEDRVIDLLNRRFVSFFYNRSGMGEGGDDAARAFAQGKTKNPYAFLAAFSADGTILGETELYADKDAVFAWLTQLLVDHPELAKPTSAEQELLERDAATLDTAGLYEELGAYTKAAKLFKAVASNRDSNPKIQRIQATLGLLRIARHTKDWDTHARLGQELRETLKDDTDLSHFLVDEATERGYRHIALGEFDAARALLQPMAHASLQSNRLAELHFLAGKACWFLEDRDWAKFHWCWVAEHLPDDRLARRSYICAAAEAMPYANHELGGFEADVGNIGTESIVRGFTQANAIYRCLLPYFAKEDFTRVLEPSERPKPEESAGNRIRPQRNLLPIGVLEQVEEVEPTTPQAPQDENETPASEVRSPTLLVARLRDGNAYRIANNKVVDQLETIGAPALQPLRTAIDDPEFPGRGYAAWALSQVLLKGKIDNPEALETLKRAAGDADSYVKVLASSGLGTLND